MGGSNSAERQNAVCAIFGSETLRTRFAEDFLPNSYLRERLPALDQRHEAESTLRADIQRQ
jgi:hypothetical protein